MSKRQLLIILGIWVMAFLFLGFPSTWDKIFSLITGLLIVAVAFKFKTVDKIDTNANVPFKEHKNYNQPSSNFFEKKNQDIVNPPDSTISSPNSTSNSETLSPIADENITKSDSIVS